MLFAILDVIVRFLWNAPISWRTPSMFWTLIWWEFHTSVAGPDVTNLEVNGPLTLDHVQNNHVSLMRSLRDRQGDKIYINSCSRINKAILYSNHGLAIALWMKISIIILLYITIDINGFRWAGDKQFNDPDIWSISVMCTLNYRSVPQRTRTRSSMLSDGSRPEHCLLYISTCMYIECVVGNRLMYYILRHIR